MAAPRENAGYAVKGTCHCEEGALFDEAISFTMLGIASSHTCSGDGAGVKQVRSSQ